MINIDPETITNRTAIYLTLNGNVSPQAADELKTIYEKFADEDGLLYIMYQDEVALG